MKKSKKLSLFGLCLLLLAPLVSHAISGVYGGGPIYKNREYAIGELKASGFSHVIVWTIHIEADGSLGFNGEFPLVKDGAYIGDQYYPDFRDDIASLKTGETSITRVEFGLSGWGSGTYDNVRDLLSCTGSHCGTGTDSILFRNFQALRNAFPAVDALNNDDEGTYHLDSAVPFHIMLSDIGFNTAVVPYQNKSFWQSFVDRVNSARSGAVDLSYLQVYAGGAGNNPCNWDLGLPLIAGLWSRDVSPSEVQSRMQGWKDTCGIDGGFMWLYDDFDNSPLVAQYADAINTVFDDANPPQTGAVSLYQHCSYDGYRVQLEPGSYTASQLADLGAVDNDVSSIKVSPGYQVTVYQYDNFSGYSWTLSGDDQCITDNTEGRGDGLDWNDDISSVVVDETENPPSNELENGVSVDGLSGIQGSESQYFFDVPDGASDLAVAISGGNGDADLYVRYGDVPTDTSYDCRPYRVGNDENCSFDSPASGRWYINLKAYSDFSGVSLVATY